jgi:hypothetical protein
MVAGRKIVGNIAPSGGLAVQIAGQIGTEVLDASPDSEAIAYYSYAPETAELFIEWTNGYTSTHPCSFTQFLGLRNAGSKGLYVNQTFLGRGL